MSRIGERVRAIAAVFWLRSLFWCTRRAPALARAVKPLALWVTWHFARGTRGSILANARWLLGASSSKRDHAAFGKRVLSNCFEAVLEFDANRQRSADDIVARLESVSGLETFESVRRAGRGVVLVTAHLGPFESAIAMLTRREPRVHVVFRRDPNPVFEKLRSEQHARLGVLEAPADDGLAGWMRLRDSLRANDVVIIQGDRVTGGDAGVIVPFMGGRARLPGGPAKLARIAGAPIVPAFAVGTETGSIRILLGDPIWPDELAWAPGEVDPAVVRIAGAIEECVRRYPDQWLVLHKVWCEEPAVTD